MVQSLWKTIWQFLLKLMYTYSTTQKLHSECRDPQRPTDVHSRFSHKTQNLGAIQMPINKRMEKPRFLPSVEADTN